MARSFGRVFAPIWEDNDFRALPMSARLAYLFLLSQPDLDHAGVIPLRVRRWSRLLDCPMSEVEEMLGDLEAARFVVVDWDTEELLVRSLIRRDEIWKQPNVFKSAAASAAACASPALKGALLAEMRRLDLTETSADIRRTRADAVTLLEPFGNPSPTPPGASRKPAAPAAPLALVDPESDTANETGNTAGRKGSRRVPEGSVRGTGEPTGKGIRVGNGEVPQDPFPLSPSPEAAPSSRETPPRRPAAGPKAEEGGDPGRERTPEAAEALIAELRALRRNWSARSIGRALDVPSVAEREWPVVCEAARILAGDPSSRHPGRLEHDGDWWPEAERRVRAGRAPAEPATGVHDFVPGEDGQTCARCKTPEANRHHRPKARTA